MSEIEKNTVKADNQLDITDYITFDGDRGVKIMIAGNSITRHGPSAEIGWNNDWGMAASSLETDYVHILMKKVCEKTDARFCINQVSKWEQNYKSPDDIIPLFTAARDFEADIIIVRFIENCKPREFDRDIFEREFDRFIKFLDKTGKARIIISTAFWKHPGDECLAEYAERNGYPFVALNDLGADSKMRADGLFEHAGVAWHPGDLGMKNIADRIFSELEKII